MTDAQAPCPPLPAHNAYTEGCDCPACRAHAAYLALGRTQEWYPIQIYTAILNEVPGSETIVLVVDRPGTRDTFPLSAEAAGALINGLAEAVKMFTEMYTVKIMPPEPAIPAQAGAREVELPA